MKFCAHIHGPQIMNPPSGDLLFKSAQTHYIAAPLKVMVLHTVYAPLLLAAFVLVNAKVNIPC